MEIHPLDLFNPKVNFYSNRSRDKSNDADFKVENIFNYSNTVIAQNNPLSFILYQNIQLLCNLVLLALR